jgi:hypothetical protein
VFCRIIQKSASQPATMLPMGARDNDDIIFLLLKMQFPFIASLLYMADIKLFLSIEEINLRRKHIPRIALLQPHVASFQALYHSRNNQAYVTFTGLDYHYKY